MVRVKVRYLLVEVNLEDHKEKLSEKLLQTILNTSTKQVVEKLMVNRHMMKVVRDNCRNNFGNYGLTHLFKNFKLIYMNPTTHLILFKVSRESCPVLEATLCLITEVPTFTTPNPTEPKTDTTCKVHFRILNKSGAVAKSYLALTQYNQILIQNLAKSLARQRLEHNQLTQGLNPTEYDTLLASFEKGIRQRIDLLDLEKKYTLQKDKDDSEEEELET